jgi:hypothetical protein
MKFPYPEWIKRFYTSLTQNTVWSPHPGNNAESFLSLHTTFPWGKYFPGLFTLPVDFTPWHAKVDVVLSTFAKERQTGTEVITRLLDIPRVEGSKDATERG